MYITIFRLQIHYLEKLLVRIWTIESVFYFSDYFYCTKMCYEKVWILSLYKIYVHSNYRNVDRSIWPRGSYLSHIKKCSGISIREEMDFRTFMTLWILNWQSRNKYIISKIRTSYYEFVPNSIFTIWQNQW